MLVFYNCQLLPAFTYLLSGRVSFSWANQVHCVEALFCWWVSCLSLCQCRAFSCQLCESSWTNKLGRNRNRHYKIELELLRKKPWERPLFEILKSSLTEDLITPECTRTVETNVGTMGNNLFWSVILSFFFFFLSSKPYKTFLPTSYSPQEGYLKEDEDMLR